MAIIYQKTASDKTCILNTRQALLRQFDFGAWTQIRLGFFFSGVTAAGDDTNSVNESVSLSNPLDRIMFGIKNSDNNTFPGYAGSSFIGTSNRTGYASDCNGNSFNQAGGAVLTAVAFDGATLIGGGAGEILSYAMEWGGSSGSATGYCGFYGVQLIIANIGTATQTVAIRNTRTSAIAGADYSESALRTYLNNGPWSGTQVVLAWNDGVAARSIPNGFFIYLPFFLNRIRLSAMMAVQYA